MPMYYMSITCSCNALKLCFTCSPYICVCMHVRIYMVIQLSKTLLNCSLILFSVIRHIVYLHILQFLLLNTFSDSNMLVSWARVCSPKCGDELFITVVLSWNSKRDILNVHCALFHASIFLNLNCGLFLTQVILLWKNIQRWPKWLQH